MYRFYGRDNFGGTADLAHHLFGTDVDAQQQTSAWQAWLAGVYA